jgi:hypothetical protein
MRLQAAMTGIGVAVIGLSLALIPPATAGATTHVEAAKSSHGANPGSAFCKLEKVSQADENSKLESAVTKALLAAKWSVAQKDLLSIEKQASTLEREFIGALSSAPAKVKSAATTLIKFVPAEENAVKSATSAADFETKEEAVTGPKFTKASETLASYQDAQCGSLTTTTS